MKPNVDIKSLEGQLKHTLRDFGQAQVDWLLNGWWEGLRPNLNSVPSGTRPKLARLFEEFGSSGHFSKKAEMILSPDWIIESMRTMTVKLVDGKPQFRFVSDHIRRADGKIDEILLEDPDQPNGIQLVRTHNWGPGIGGIEFPDRKYPPLPVLHKNGEQKVEGLHGANEKETSQGDSANDLSSTGPTDKSDDRQPDFVPPVPLTMPAPSLPHPSIMQQIKGVWTSFMKGLRGE